ncbi:hypothetical protein [uncultured Brachyspira sp.]|nr:hypothetical protein [uncultured Brachyspira sp.]
MQEIIKILEKVSYKPFNIICVSRFYCFNGIRNISKNRMFN